MCNLSFPEFKRGDEIAFWCESHVARIIAQQETIGVNFDVRLAKESIRLLEEERTRLYTNIRPILRIEVVRPYNKPVSKPFKKDGSYTKQVTGWYGEDASLVGGPFERVEFQEPDLGSRTKLINQLLALGWKPTAYTPRTEKGGGGNPKLTPDGEPCPNLLKLTGAGADIARWYIATHRQNQIKGWIKRLRPDGRLSAEANTIGTPTYRFTHKTVVNVPKAEEKVWYGSIMRSLFFHSDGRLFVGNDASGLEIRMLAHYINDPEYTDIVLNGDIHWHHVQMLGFVPKGTERDEHDPDHSHYRNVAKTFIYAFIYGGGDGKLGEIIGGTAADGRRLRNTFLGAMPKLKALIDGVKSASSRGYLVGLDGRRVYLRRDKLGRLQKHKALNTLLQAAGAIVMKYSMVWLDFQVQQQGVDAWKVIDMHDEAQADVLEGDAERYVELARESIPWAGRYLNLNIPLAADVKVGKNWAETH